MRGALLRFRRLPFSGGSGSLGTPSSPADERLWGPQQVVAVAQLVSSRVVKRVTGNGRIRINSNIRWVGLESVELVLEHFLHATWRTRLRRTLSHRAQTNDPWVLDTFM